jgi:hypothetical protein
MTMPDVNVTEPADLVAAELAAARARIGELEAAAQQHPAEAAAVPAGPTHYLHLADGSTVDGYGAIPTEISQPDGPPVPVMAAYPR